MSFDEKTVWLIQEKTQFNTDNIEKVLRLLEILNEIFAHPVLNKFYALKGNTTMKCNEINIRDPFVVVKDGKYYMYGTRGANFGQWTAGFDIDLNYQGLDRSEMLENKKEHEKIFQKLFQVKGYTVKRMPEEHAGGKWRLNYKNIMGQDQNLEVDLAYMLRVPLMPVEIRSSNDFCGFKAQNIRVLNIHELAAGKFCALLSRCKPRDLFDAHLLLHNISWNKQKLRECFTTYAAFNKDDFSQIDALGDMKFDLSQFKAQLITTLPAGSITLSPEEYLNKLITECRGKLDIILPFSDSENKFLQEVNFTGNIYPEMVSEDEAMQMNIRNHPMLAWKCLNVKNYRSKQK